MAISIESIRSGDEEQRHDLRRQAFGMTAAYDPDVPLPDPVRTVAAYDGDHLLATVVTLDFRMTWGGATLPCGGVSGVVVRPEARGRGLAKQLVQESYARMRERGEVLAALYPTTATLYRSQGFEVAGSLEWRHVPIELVPTAPAAELTWRRVEFDDPALRRVHEAMSARLDGWIHADDVWWARMAHQFTTEKTTNRYAYVGARDGDDVAGVIYRYDRSDDRLYDLGLDLCAGVDEHAVAAALGFLASNGTTAGKIETTLPAAVLALHVPNVQHTRLARSWPWMLRLVDAAGAFAGRPVSAGVQGSVPLDIVDPTVTANAGPAVLEFADGRAALSPGGPGRVRADIGDLAAIYAGADVGLLRNAGRLEGATDADVALLTAACAAHPTMPFFF